VRGDRLGRLFVPVLLCIALFAGAYQTLVPVLADRVFGDTNHWTAVFFSAAGAGGLSAAVLLSSTHMAWALRRLQVVIPWLTGCGVAGLGLVRQPWLAVACFGLIGFGMAFVSTSTTATLHQRVPAEARGGLIALLLMSFVGAIPVAQLLGGFLAQWLSVQVGFAVLAAALFACLSLLFVPRWWALGRIELNPDRF
jgi:MFS family permease